ncbi:hypothetical protein L345_09466, partial [Ophiophagus hannah]
MTGLDRKEYMDGTNLCYDAERLERNHFFTSRDSEGEKKMGVIEDATAILGTPMPIVPDKPIPAVGIAMFTFIPIMPWFIIELGPPMEAIPIVLVIAVGIPIPTGTGLPINGFAGGRRGIMLGVNIEFASHLSSNFDGSHFMTVQELANEGVVSIIFAYGRVPQCFWLCGLAGWGGDGSMRADGKSTYTAPFVQVVCICDCHSHKGSVRARAHLFMQDEEACNQNDIFEFGFPQQEE